jgi:hypothetical protein
MHARNRRRCGLRSRQSRRPAEARAGRTRSTRVVSTPPILCRSDRDGALLLVAEAEGTVANGAESLAFRVPAPLDRRKHPELWRRQLSVLRN